MTAELKKFAIPIEGIPNGWEPVAFGDVKAGDFFLSEHGDVTLKGILIAQPRGPRLILRTKYTPPTWLKEAGFKAIWRDEGNKWYAAVETPEWRDGSGGYYFTESECCCLATLNFTPPEFPPEADDKETLIEL